MARRVTYRWIVEVEAPRGWVARYDSEVNGAKERRAEVIDHSPGTTTLNSSVRGLAL
jgi:hypothetical protein